MQPESHGPVPDHAERRRAPRIELLSRIHGQQTTGDVPITLLNLSSGGFLMRTPTELPVGTIEEFRLTTNLGAAVVVRARVMRSIHVTSGDNVSYVIGLEFVDRREQGINDLVACLQR